LAVTVEDAYDILDGRRYCGAPPTTRSGP